MTLAPTLPPHSVEAEQAVLGGLLLDNDSWDLLADQLCAEDFFRQEHRLIFRAIEALATQNVPFDVVTLGEKLETQPEAGGLAYLGELARNIPSVANLRTYVQIVRDRAHRRRLMQFGFACYREANEPDVMGPELQERFEQRLFSLGQHLQAQEFIDLQDCLSTVIDEIDRHFNAGCETTGLPSGLATLDEHTSGFQPADLIIVAARPSMGKTSLALSFVETALLARPEHSVQIYSLEMPARALIYRLLALLGHLSLSRLLKGALLDEDWTRLTVAAGKLKAFASRLVIDDTPALSCAALRARARRASRRFGMPALVLIDYLQLMRASQRENRNLEITEISGSLKALAKELNCPVIALSQLNRALEQRGNKRPLLSDLRESGAIEQDADLILFVYRDEVYNPESDARGTAELIIGKHRNGPTGTARCAFIAEQARFASLAAPSSWSAD
jgi:replicative DNA helicase